MYEGTTVVGHLDYEINKVKKAHVSEDICLNKGIYNYYMVIYRQQRRVLEYINISHESVMHRTPL